MMRDEGFTLVEILVVMLILGLLAAIAIPSFFNQREKARDAGAKEAARTAETAAETIATDNNHYYDGPDGVSVANLRAIEKTLEVLGPEKLLGIVLNGARVSRRGYRGYY